MISVRFQDKPFNITVIQVYALTINAKEATRPTRPSRTNTQKRCPFHYRGPECKSRKSRDTWSNKESRTIKKTEHPESMLLNYGVGEGS